MIQNSATLYDEKKVCIVVPVYNAEKYLGYCLNSILSQTHTNWNAILVDDGSTDSSLDICRQYEKLDSRFKVVTKKNGGVSSARNTGLQYATGDYLEFLDSDDCLAQDTLEKQIKLAVDYECQLVLMDILMVDFSDPSLERILLSSDWLKQSPCVLSAEEFKQKRMRLVWFTVLLECLHAKLYDLSLWKKNEISFPEDLSLGEDFVANMRYFEACDKVVFLHECGHYYNCIMGSGSLTQKYRADLFETKMYLMDKLEEHLGGRRQLSKEELDAFYCYTASSGLGCVEKAVLDSGLTGDKLYARVKEMLEHELFAESIIYASYIPDRFVACMDSARQGDYQAVIDYIAGVRAPDKQETAESQTVEPEVAQQACVPAEFVPRKPGFVNRAIRKLMRAVAPVFGNGSMAERINRWESEIKEFGLKYTLGKHLRDHRRMPRYQVERQVLQLEAHVDSRMHEVQNSVANHSAGLNRQISSVHKEMQGLCAEMEGQNKATKDLYADVQNKMAELHTEVKAQQNQAKEVHAEVEGVVEKLSEQNEQFGSLITDVRADIEKLAEQNVHFGSLMTDVRTDIEKLSGIVCEQIQRSEAHSKQLSEEILAISPRLEKHLETLAVALRNVENRIALVENQCAASVERCLKEVNGYVWLSEQRISQYAYLRDINELRQRKKAILVATAEHTNIGDAAITLAQQQILAEQFPEYFQVEISTYEFEKKESFLHAILNAEDIIFLNGGGNMGDLYPEEEALHRKIVGEFPNNKIVIFPQTIHFSGTEHGAQEISKSARVYNNHPDLTLFVRGEQSLAFAKKYFENVKTVLMPDAAHVLRTNYSVDRKGALLCLREDKEKNLSGENEAKIKYSATALAGDVDYSTNVHSEDISRDIRALVVRKELMRFANHQIVITDRLHGMIFAVVTGTPCVVLKSGSQKIPEYYEAFLKDSNGVFFVDDQLENLDDAIKCALSTKQTDYPLYEKSILSEIRKHCF